MNLKEGIYIKSTLAMDDPNFINVTVLITELNPGGAVGFIVNKTFPGKLNELLEFHHCESYPIADGGPVDREHLFFIHKRPDLIEEGREIGNGLYVGGNFKQAIAAINQGSIENKQLSIFIGYCGWDKGELEAEISEGSWVILNEKAID